jgi:hypothetical protein
MSLFSFREIYAHTVYLYDEGVVRRVVDVVCSTTSRPAKYEVATQFIEMINVYKDGDEEEIS